MKLKENIQVQTTFAHLVTQYQLMMKNGDEQNAAKILDLYEKLESKELIISFSGHFSAGKSSMINALLGEDLLAKSPIPTSANIVKISSGEGVARVYFHNDEAIEFSEPYDLEMIKSYSMDKNAIKKIEISTGERILPPGTVIMDTPGIDSADDADRFITESSLHLVDILFYVMDYNHVQSEVNLQFLKNIQEKSIPFYVIINQIDKHEEAELPFEAYVNRIKQTFEKWGLLPENIFFTSLFDHSLGKNQFKILKNKLNSLMHEEKENAFLLDASFIQVVNAHQRFIREHYDELALEWSDVSDEQMEHSKLAHNTLINRVKELQDKPYVIEKNFNQELQSTLNNAYLMPSSLRDKAQLFLESQQKNFKVGLFASNKKTAQEKQKRLSNFLESLQENMQTLIQWKLRDKFLNLIHEYDLSEPELQAKIQSLTVIYNEEELIKIIKPGAKVNGDYVLNYTNDVAADVKQKFRHEAKNILPTIKASIEKINKEKLATVKTDISAIEKVIAQKNKLDSLQLELQEKLVNIEQQLSSPTTSHESWTLIQAAREEKLNSIELVEKPIVSYVTMEELAREEITEPTIKNTSSVERIVQRISETMNVIQDLPGFETLKHDLINRREQLMNRSYTIALFGAFSAGKSSFSNALLGNHVLPVSPNPTTAVVNRIRPVTEEHRHGDVIISLKDEKTLVQDLLEITKNFLPTETTLDGLLEWVKTNQIHQDVKLNKMYQSYLQAMLHGYKHNKERIGKQIRIGLDEFETYVTDEARACYFEKIDLYYNSELTRQGITLVDTPGADSVNARHTNVAFDYIKHADAILYVTYYNHALSRADRDFLLQLGRVKESFQLDKMFFIVNAADLAADADELKLVMNYVQNELLKLGIRLPNLYPVSSKQSLTEKLSKQPLNTEMQGFEDRFYRFIHHDLTELTVESARWDMTRTYQMLKKSLETLQLDEKQKQVYQRELNKKRERLELEIAQTNVAIYEDQLKQKIEKQLYYVVERLSIRFHDMYKEYYNPTTVTDSGRQARVQLWNNLEGLIEYISYELHQELNAVSLRIEQFIQAGLAELYKGMTDLSKQIHPIFILPNRETIKLETPHFEQAFTNIDLAIFDSVLTTFKGTKAFFEKNEKEQMKEKLYHVISPLATRYIEENKLVMKDAYTEQWEKIIVELKFETQQAVSVQFHNHIEMMETTTDISTLLEKEENLKAIIDNYNIEDVS